MDPGTLSSTPPCLLITNEELRKTGLEGYKSILILAVLAYMVSALVTTLSSHT
jgi:hypothetical protein